MKSVITILVVVVIVGGVAFGLYYLSAKKKAAKATPKPKIVQVKPEWGPLKESVTSTGSVASNLDVEIKCKASGQVISLPFDVSDSVKKGDLVVELDPVDEQRNVDQARVSLSASKAKLAQAQQNLAIAESDLESARKKADVNLEIALAKAADERAKAGRMKQLYEQKLAGQEEYETAETSALNAESAAKTAQLQKDDLKTTEKALELKRQDVLLAKTNVESSQINETVAEQRLQDTKVYAPIDGVVTSRAVQTGQIISSGISNTGGGTTILTLSDLTRLFVLASVDESDIGGVTVGQKAEITADAYPGKTFEGAVERVAPMGVSVSNVVTFEVRIEVTGENKSLLKPEMTANVVIIIQDKQNVLNIPVEGVTKAKGKNMVTVLKPDGTSESREVQVGINDGVNVEIVSSLTENDIVLVNETTGNSQWSSRGGNANPGANRPVTPMGLMGGRPGGH